jgi:hypothetical protein
MTALPTMTSTNNDAESTEFLHRMIASEEIRANRIAGVRSVLVILSSRGMVFDIDALRQKILLSYPDATVFFRTTMGKPVGAASPRSVDLLIDFTGPGMRQGLFAARGFRRMARVATGRNAGLFRKGSYDRVFDEKKNPPGLPRELLERERYVQRKVLEMIGVSLAPLGETPPDLGKSIALELPPMLKL